MRQLLRSSPIPLLHEVAMRRSNCVQSCQPSTAGRPHASQNRIRCPVLVPNIFQTMLRVSIAPFEQLRTIDSRTFF